MAVQGELPDKENTRGGAGWWMDPQGVWRPPEEWPEETAPFDGWKRGEDGRWSAPISAAPVATARERVETESPEKVAERKRLSRQARADRRAMLTVIGAIVGAALLLGVALVLITQAGATGNGVASSSEDEPEVIYAADTDADVRARLEALAQAAPGIAAGQLAALEIADTASADDFDPTEWVTASTGCLSVAEEVLVQRSAVEIVWADQLQCVPDRGRWTDRYLNTNIRSVIEADVQPLIPAVVAFQSGASEWSLETRTAFLSDTEHPATLHIVAADGGHNPREQAPDEWRPSNRSSWCAYATDWVAVKARWDLTVTEAEAEALTDMLATCDESDSAGADPTTLPTQPITDPAIVLQNG